MAVAPRRPAVVSSALAIALLHGTLARSAPRTWIEVKSPNFTVVSDADEGSARGVAWQFEQARAAFTRLWSWARPRGGRPFVVFAAVLGQACDSGDRRSCLNVAVLQLKTKKPGDEARAVATLSALCDEGQKEACTMLALQYAGKATAADQTRARDLLHKACDAGEPAACRALQSMPK
jgi:TPR repeat protein